MRSSCCSVSRPQFNSDSRHLWIVIALLVLFLPGIDGHVVPIAKLTASELVVYQYWTYIGRQGGRYWRVRRAWHGRSGSDQLASSQTWRACQRYAV